MHLGHQRWLPQGAKGRYYEELSRLMRGLAVLFAVPVVLLLVTQHWRPGLHGLAFVLIAVIAECSLRLLGEKVDAWVGETTLRAARAGAVVMTILPAIVTWQIIYGGPPSRLSFQAALAASLGDSFGTILVVGGAVIALIVSCGPPRPWQNDSIRYGAVLPLIVWIVAAAVFPAHRSFLDTGLVAAFAFAAILFWQSSGRVGSPA
jgi:hypothetical protein